MANSLGKLWILLLATTACSALAAQDNHGSNGLVLSMKSLSLDGDGNLIHLIGPRIAQGSMEITADEALATGTDFDTRSEWQFKGNVRVEVDSAVLTASSAKLVFDADRLASAELTGSPASVTDLSKDRKEPVHGSADKLLYDNEKHTLHLLGDVWLYKGRNEIQGCDVDYDFSEERLTSGSSECGVRVRVMPSAADSAANDTHAPP